MAAKGSVEVEFMKDSRISDEEGQQADRESEGLYDILFNIQKTIQISALHPVTEFQQSAADCIARG